VALEEGEGVDHAARPPPRRSARNAARSRATRSTSSSAKSRIPLDVTCEGTIPSRATAGASASEISAARAAGGRGVERVSHCAPPYACSRRPLYGQIG